MRMLRGKVEGVRGRKSQVLRKVKMKYHCKKAEELDVGIHDNYNA
jgi:hypothetical protein